MKASKLSAKGLTKSFRSRQVLKGVNLSVESGQIVGLLGPNGAGKTTSFYMIVGILYPQSGSIFLDSEEITRLPMHERARLGISYLPQNMSIFRRLSVEENLLAVMEIVGTPPAERNSMLDELLEKFQVTHIRKSLGAALSGGERRRVEIARALVMKPTFLLLDEPFAGIDPVTVQEIQQIISKLKDEGLGVLITDHNVRETLGICDHAFILANGDIIAEGLPETISNNQKVKDFYLGTNFKL